MTKPNFEKMTKAELRAYVLEHRNDIEAFHVLMSKLTIEPGTKITSMEHLAELIQEKRRVHE